MSIPLDTAGNTRFDSSGIARVEISCSRPNVAWRVKRMVSTTSSVSQTDLLVYKNVETPSARIDSTSAANEDTSEVDIRIGPGEKLVFIWSKGTPNAYATISISGELEKP